MRSRFAVIALLAVTPAARAVAQDHAHGAPQQLGRVTFPVSCTPEARQRFERAMAVLHSFWWEQGPAAFSSVLEVDATCAMAYWGLAMNAWGNPFAGGPSGEALRTAQVAVERATTLGGKTAREAGFIAAAGALYRNAATTSNTVRLQAYADTMARVYRDHPTDDEVTLYYALALIATAPKTDTTFANQKRAAALLNPLYAKHTDHPGLAHYIIHANDSPQLAALGLDAARRYAGIAPSAPHAQHMPSHIFIRLGLWDETVASNQKAFDAGVSYARAAGRDTLTYEQFHALDYMVYGYLQRGQDSAARRVVATARALPPARAPSALLGSYNRVAMEARLLLERGDWAAAARLSLPGDSAAPLVQALTHYARGIGAVRSGDTVQARAAVTELARIEQVLTAAKEPYWTRIVGVKRQSLHAWLLFAAGDTAGAFREAAAAADVEDVTDKHPITPAELLPARELLADMHLAAGHGPAARDAYQATLVREPGRARSIFGTARAAEVAGDQAGAINGYRAFLAVMAKSDGGRAEIAAARRVVGRP